jgi:hypothetical protein
MANIPVSIDARGNLNVPDLSASRGEAVTWSIDASQGTITAITQGTAFSAAPVNNRGTWSANVEGSTVGQLSYDITVDPSDGGASKTKAPRISVVAPMPESVETPNADY